MTSRNLHHVAFLKNVAKAGLLLAVGLHSLFAAADITSTEQPKSFIILPITEPVEINVRHYNFAFTSSGQRKALNDAIRKVNLTVGSDLENLVSKNLVTAGFQRVKDNSIRVDPVDPRNVNYKAIKQPVDAIVHLYLDGVGLISSNSVTGSTPFQSEYANFVPYVFVSYCVIFRAKGDTCHIEGSGVYGNRTAADAHLEYRSAPQDVWFALSDAEAEPQRVANAIRTGALQLGMEITGDIVKELQLLPAISRAAVHSEAKSSSITPNNIAERIRMLDTLRREGLISPEDYSTTKALMLKKL